MIMKTLFVKLLLITLSLIFLTQCGKKTPEDQFMEARKLFKNNDILGARIKLKEIIKKYPNEPVIYDAYLVLADTYVVDGDLEEQRNILQKVIDKYGLKSEKGIKALASKMDSYDYQSNFDSAIKELKEAVKLLGPNSIYDYSMNAKIAYFYECSKKYDEAISLYEELLKRYEKDEGKYKNTIIRLAGVYEKQKDIKSAINVYEIYINKYPKNPSAGLIKAIAANLYNKINETKKAYKYFNDSITQLKKSIDETLNAEEKTKIMLFLAQAYGLKGELELAVQTNETIVDKYKDSQNVILAMWGNAQLYKSAGKKDKAIEWFTKILNTSKNPAEVRQIKMEIDTLQGKSTQTNPKDVATTQAAAKKEKPKK